MVKFIEDFLMSILKFIARTLRRFVFYSLIMFVLGMLYGEFVNQMAQKLIIPAIWLTVLPIILAVTSYYVTEVAVLVFLLLLGVFLIAFL